MKKAYTALALAFLLALSLCSPAMAAMEYGVIYDETESLNRPSPSSPRRWALICGWMY